MTVLVVDQAVKNEDKGKGLCGRAAFPHAVVCSGDSDCGSGYWCNAGFDTKLNRCERKLNKGEVCGKIGEVGVGHRCKSGSCRASLGVNLKCV